MGDSLNPTLASRISTVLRPDWTRTVLARRVAAGGLVVLAGIAALRSDPEGDRVEVLVAARDLGSGAALNDSDVRTEKRLATTVPEGSMTDPGRVIGATLASPTRRGEVLTDVRLLGSRLAESTAGPGALG
jgi:flagella basal body P-ring formation protein FlgA